MASLIYTHESTVKTYACKKAIANSKPIIANITISGRICRTYITPPAESIVQPNPAIIFKSVCPAIMFAKSRTAKLITRKL